MIFRPFTLIAGMLFVLSGAVMFVVKHQSQALEDQISEINEATTHDEQSIRVLQAQWALEADPSRLAALAAQFTGLQPMKPGQLTTMTALASALPAPGAAAPGVNPEDPVPPPQELAAAPPAPTAPPGAAPAQVATAAPAAAAPGTAVAPAPAQAVAATPQPRPAAPVELAAAHVVAPPPAAVHHNASPAHLAAAAPVHHAVPVRHEASSALYMASAVAPPPPAHAVPVGAQLVPVRAVAAPAPAPAPQDDGGSLLGMAQGDPP